MLCYEGQVSFICFAITCGLLPQLTIPAIFALGFDYHYLFHPVFYYILINICFYLLLRGNNNTYQIAVRAAFLGFVLAESILIIFNSELCWKPFGFYGVHLSLFHYSEYMAIAWSNPKTLSVDSFILNHSIQYAIAAALSWTEFFIEAWLYPGLKEYYIFWILGVLMCLSGEFLRKLAIITASSNFNHLLQFVKSEDHQLVTHGIYGIMRHPSYVGWFIWSIGTQIILVNPICTILYTAISWKFFNDRIYLEEITLCNFFGVKYYNYQQKVPTGLPFIKGFEEFQGMYMK